MLFCTKKASYILERSEGPHEHVLLPTNVKLSRSHERGFSEMSVLTQNNKDKIAFLTRTSRKIVFTQVEIISLFRTRGDN